MSLNVNQGTKYLNNFFIEKGIEQNVKTKDIIKIFNSLDKDDNGKVDTFMFAQAVENEFYELITEKNEEQYYLNALETFANADGNNEDLSMEEIDSLIDSYKKAYNEYSNKSANNETNNAQLNDTTGASGGAASKGISGDTSVIVAAISSEDLAGQDLQSLIRGRSETLSQLSDMQTMKDNNPAIQKAELNVGAKKEAYDQTLNNFQTQDQALQGQIDEQKAAKQVKDSAISNQKTSINATKNNISQIKNTLTSEKSELNSINSNLSGLTEPPATIEERYTDSLGKERTRSVHNPAHDHYLAQKAALEGQKAAQENRIAQTENELANAQDELANQEEVLATLEDEATAIDNALLELFQNEQILKTEGAQEVLDSLNSYKEAQTNLQNVKIQETKQINENIAQLRENLTAFNEAVHKAEEKENEEALKAKDEKEKKLEEEKIAKENKIKEEQEAEEKRKEAEIAEIEKSKEWDEVSAKDQKSFGLFNTGDKVFTTADGTQIKLANIEGVKVYQNKKTNEIIVIGANGAEIKGSKEDVAIKLYDSHIKELKTQGGNDSITLSNAIIGALDSGEGNDKINVTNSEVININSGKGDDKIDINTLSSIYAIGSEEGNDEITIKDSRIEKGITTGENNDKIDIKNSFVLGINAGNSHDEINIEDNSTLSYIFGDKGNDKILVKDSNITQFVDAGDNNDTVITKNSEVKYITLGKGNDNAYLIGSTVRNITGEQGDDNINVAENSKVYSIEGNDGNDLLQIKNSIVDIVNGGIGEDIIRIKDSNIKDIAEDKNDDVEINGDDFKIDIQDMDEETISTATLFIDKLTEKYGPLTAEEKAQALTLEHLIGTLENMNSIFDDQELNDGKLADKYNWGKQLLDLGVSKEDIDYALTKQKTMIEELEATFKDGATESFNEVFERWTGVQYNQENINNYLTTYNMYALASTGNQKAALFQEEVEKANSLGDVLKEFRIYYGSEEKAIAELNKYLKEGGEAIWQQYGFGRNIKDIKITDDFKLSFSCDNEYYTGNNGEANTIIRELELSDIPNIVAENIGCYDENRFIKEYIEKFEATTGFSYEEIRNNMAMSEIQAFGKGNAFQDLVDKYKAEQDGFADAIANTTQLAGLGAMIVGGVLVPVCPAVAGGILTTGKTLAFAGTFLDEGIEFADNLSSENGLSKEESARIFKDALLDGMLLYSGAKIGGFAGKVNSKVLNLTKSQVLAKMAEVGTDTTLSLLTDRILTGECSLSGESINQLLGILTGVAGSKVDSYKFDDADIAYKNGDVHGAYEILRNRHVTNSDIRTHYTRLEFERLNNIYKESHDLNLLYESVVDSPFFKNKYIKLIDGCKDVDLKNLQNFNSNVPEINTFFKNIKSYVSSMDMKLASVAGIQLLDFAYKADLMNKKVEEIGLDIQDEEEIEKEAKKEEYKESESEKAQNDLIRSDEYWDTLKANRSDIKKV